MKKKIRVGSRESKLAMVQTHWVIHEISRKHPELDFEVVGITTKGDVLLDTRLDKIGGKGLFIKELEHALMEGRIDIAVHSMKDMPSDIHEKLTIAAVSKREDPRDVLITASGIPFDKLPNGAVIGTSSVRREVQLRDLRPDLNFKVLRGNVLTRMDKLLSGEYDAVVLAAAGLKRLGLEEKCTQFFDVQEMIPAVGQGALAIEARKEEDTDYLLDSVHCADTAAAVIAERAFLIRLNGGCSVPLAAHARVHKDRIIMTAMLASEDKSKMSRSHIEGKKEEAGALGIRLAEDIVRKLQV